MVFLNCCLKFVYFLNFCVCQILLNSCLSILDILLYSATLQTLFVLHHLASLRFHKQGALEGDWKAGEREKRLWLLAFGSWSSVYHLSNGFSSSSCGWFPGSTCFLPLFRVISSRFPGSNNPVLFPLVVSIADIFNSHKIYLIDSFP